MIMEQNRSNPRKPNSQRKQRSKTQVFKEVYLPAIILTVTAVLILVFIIGGIIRHSHKNDVDPGAASNKPSSNAMDANAAAQLAGEADRLLKSAEALAEDYDYEKALEVLDTFSGNHSDFPDLEKAYRDYTDALNALVSWPAGQVPNLSCHVLIADPSRAFNDKSLGDSYKKNFITVNEFSAILQQLYDNGYVLVSMDDLYDVTYDEDSGRDIYVEKVLKLPAGMKPIMLTETNANYYTYMVDSNGDGKEDAGGDGFAAKLAYGENGFYSEIVRADGSVSTGAYDMVPILENFIAEHPEFSYRNARAIIAFTGYDGILGYRINSGMLSAEALKLERAKAKEVTDALRATGYELACYTYQNQDYSKVDAAQIQSDLKRWKDEVSSIVGDVDTLVYAWEGDIGGDDIYSGSKFNVLYSAGFRFYIGASSAPWNQVNDLYVRHNRLMLTGENLLNHADWFKDLFDAAAVLDSSRPHK